MTNPVISVVIMAHDRKQYLARAIKSASNQTLDRGLYEIIVIKNFEDEEIEDLSKKVGAHSIFTEKKNIGDKIALGVSLSKGDLIAFLEDDDWFSKNRLEIIMNRFKENELCYFHNSPEEVDESGTVVIDRSRKLKRDEIVRASNNNTLKFEWYSSGISNIAIKTDVLMRYLEPLKRMSFALDVFMLFVAIDSGRNMFFDRRKLTSTMIHTKSESNLEGRSSDEFFKKKATSARRNLQDFITMQSCFNAPLLKKRANWSISHYKAVIHLAAPEDQESKLRAYDYVNLLNEGFHHDRSALALFLTLFLQRIFPRLTRELYFKRISTRHAHHRIDSVR